MLSNKMRIVLFLVIVISSVAYYFFLEKKNEYDGKDVDSHAQFEQAPLITITSDEKNDPIKKERIISGTPIVSIIGNQTATKNSNLYIERFLEDEKSYYESLQKIDAESASSTQNLFSTFSNIPKIILNTPKVFVIRFDESILLLNSSKAESRVRFIIYDILNDSPLQTGSIFPNQSTKEKIRSYLSTLSTTDGGQNTDKIVEAFSLNNHINIDEQGLTISVDSYIESDGQSVSKEVIIPFSVIESEIDPNIKEILLTKKEYIRMSEPE